MAVEGVNRLEHPIDVMPLMHKAFRALSDRTEELASKATTIEDIEELNQTFGFWVKQILYHATVEDEVMTGPLKDGQPLRDLVRDNETEHADLVGKAGELTEFIAKGPGSGLAESVRDAGFTLEDEQHKELEDRFHEVEAILHQVLGDQKVIKRTIRHIHSRVIGVRTLELDHFENEEAFVCSLVRDEINEAGQLHMVRRLLVDDSAEDPRWILDWVHSELDAADQAALEDLEVRFQGAVTQAVLKQG